MLSSGPVVPVSGAAGGGARIERHYQNHLTQLMNTELLSLTGRPDYSRREFMVTTLAAGFALAVQPVSSATITTNQEGLTAGEVKIPVGDGQMPAYRAMPATGKTFPVVLVVQEI